MSRLFNHARRSLVYHAATCLSLVAAIFVSAPSVLYIHQPQAPEELLK